MDLNILKKPLDVFIGSGAAIAITSGVYIWIIKGRVKIPRDFDIVHSDDRFCRHRIKVYNRGFKTLQGLVCYISFKDLTPSDITGAEDNTANNFLISKGNFVPVIDELIIWDTGNASFDLHPKQYVDVDLLHYDTKNRTLVVPSEQGYTKIEEGKPVTRARMQIKKLREYVLGIKFCANNYHSREYKFKIKPREDASDVFIEKIK